MSAMVATNLYNDAPSWNCMPELAANGTREVDISWFGSLPDSLRGEPAKDLVQHVTLDIRPCPFMEFSGILHQNWWLIGILNTL
jgi:hypothetical protein